MAKLTKDEIEQRLRQVAPHLKIIGDYVTALTPCKFYDTEADAYFEAKPKDIFRGHVRGHPSLSRARQKETNRKRYGAECSLQNEDVKNKIKKTNLERYGVENPSQSDLIKERRKETSLRNFGVDNPMQCDEVKNKMFETYRDKTGFENPFCNPECMQTAKETSLSRYGVPHPMQNLDIQQKRANTFSAKYGKEYPSQVSEIREKQLATLTKNQKDGSKPQKEILTWIRSLGIHAAKGYIGGKEPCEIDIVCSLPGKKLGVECNGDYWHSELFLPKHYHANKTAKALQSGMELIHIFESEWKTKKDLVKDFIAAKLGLCRRIFARKCSIEEIGREESFKFFEDNHLQGKPHLHLKTFGLFHDNELVAAASFSRPHRQNMKEIQLSRFASCKGVVVVGGLSKLCKHAYKQLGEFVSFAHLRLGSGKAYYRAGFSLVGSVKPDYWYWDSKKKKTVSKQSRKKKQVNTPKNKTEHQHALEDGLLRIYDCGKSKFFYSG